MTVNVHQSSEGLKVIMAVIAFAVFVVIALTWVPEPISGTENMGATGNTARMVK